VSATVASTSAEPIRATATGGTRAMPVTREGARPAIAPLREVERRRAERLLAEAFRDNPLNVAVIGPGEGRRLRSNLHGMRALLATALGRATVLAARASASGVPDGVLLALAPRRFPLPPPPLRERLRCLAGQGLRVGRRWAQVYEALARVHPVDAHWYLGVLGVAPAAQRSGLGSALLEAWLAGVDRETGAAYLETDRPENLAFYARAGFDVVRELEVLGARVWCMRRPARGSNA
jgi:ribosomal protein S18 acetylase RimI-like enzyme